MIQRKQTLFLLAVAIIAILLFFIPFQKLVTTDNTWAICLMPGCSSEVISSDIYYTLILNIIILALTLGVIFLYKNRVLQFKLANLIALFNVILVGLFFLLSFTKLGMGSISYQIGAFLPLVSAVLAYLAAHFIKKDEQLVRSADRIR